MKFLMIYTVCAKRLIDSTCILLEKKVVGINKTFISSSLTHNFKLIVSLPGFEKSNCHMISKAEQYLKSSLKCKGTGNQQ